MMTGMDIGRKAQILALLFLAAVYLGGCGAKSRQADSGNVLPSDAGGEEAGEESPEENPDKEDAALGEELRDDAQEQNAKIQIPEKTDRPRVKGIFVTGPMAGTANMEHLIALVDETELNAIVLDVKNDEGRITYDMQIPAVLEIESGIRYIRDMESLIEECREKNIYLIARIVTFKDPFLAEVKPEWCIHHSDGSIFRDKDGLAWLDPYNHEVWEYLLDVAKEAIRIGFDEVQFDYVRFSTDSGMTDVDFGQEAEGKNREEIITDFIKYASEEIHEAGGAISADVYGMVIDSRIDQQIVGQNYIEMSKYLDYISPMVYPSHYGPYNYNIPVPDAEPYRLVLTALQSSRKVLAGVPKETVSGNMETEYTAEEIAALAPMEGTSAQVRPWLQDFTATWVKGHISYGPEQIRAQIQAVYDAGYEEWILWNAANRYTEDGLLREEN